MKNRIEEIKKYIDDKIGKDKSDQLFNVVVEALGIGKNMYGSVRLDKAMMFLKYVVDKVGNKIDDYVIGINKTSDFRWNERKIRNSQGYEFIDCIGCDKGVRYSYFIFMYAKKRQIVRVGDLKPVSKYFNMYVEIIDIDGDDEDKKLIGCKGVLCAKFNSIDNDGKAYVGIRLDNNKVMLNGIANLYKNDVIELL